MEEVSGALGRVTTWVDGGSTPEGSIDRDMKIVPESSGILLVC